MTREEAIQILADLIDSPFLHTWEKQNKALHMAIEALSERNIAREIATILENEQDMRVILQNEVVRCKDCRWFKQDSSPVGYGYCDGRMVGREVAYNDYCSYGQRVCQADARRI